MPDYREEQRKALARKNAKAKKKSAFAADKEALRRQKEREKRARDAGSEVRSSEAKQDKGIRSAGSFRATPRYTRKDYIEDET